MKICVGIPRALLYYEFGQLWMNYFQELGVATVVSQPTSKRLLNSGTTLAMDESCLPLKIYLGHVDSLLPQCTHVFVPRIVSHRKNYFYCAKIAGLPDIVTNTFSISRQQVIAPDLETGSLWHQLNAVHTVCRSLGYSFRYGWSVYQRSVRKWKQQRMCQTPSMTSRISIAVIGHSYLLQDQFLCQDIFSALAARNIDCFTPDDLSVAMLHHAAARFRQDVYWQLSAKIVGATEWYCRQRNIAGIIVVSGFGCGYDSLINEYVKHHVLELSGKPHMFINLDEHTGTAGLMTRMDAFIDLLAWRSEG